MKTLLITTAFLTAPIATVSAQSTDVLKSQVAEQNRQIIILEKEVRSLQSLLDLERARHNKVKTKAKTTATIAPTTSGKVHTIVAGETFSSVARKHKVSLASLIAANKSKNPNRISIGDKINLPGKAVTITRTTKPKAKKTTAKKVSAPKASKNSYKVATGDTFYGIARKNGVSVARIIALNPGIKPSKLQVGQVVKLTGTAAKPISAPVKKKIEKSRVAKHSTPKKQATKKTTKPAPKKEVAALPEVKSQPVTNTTKKTVAKTVTVNRVMTYGQFASKNGTSISVLNKLNGLDLPSDEPMAVGSALYVPNNY